MKLRLTSGILKNRTITVSGNFRPTAERTRQAVMNILQEQLPGAQAADLCAGSGAVGFEMLSRGAAHVDFIEADRRCAQAIRQTALDLGVEKECKIHALDVRSYIKRLGGQYDIVFYDPPYDDQSLAVLIPLLLTTVRQGGVLVYERRKAKRGSGATALPLIVPTQQREYGDSVVDFFTRDDAGVTSECGSQGAHEL